MIRCPNCRAWDPSRPADAYANDFPDRGYCRRFAPRGVICGQLVQPGQTGEVLVAWPITFATDGCCDGLPISEDP